MVLVAIKQTMSASMLSHTMATVNQGCAAAKDWCAIICRLKVRSFGFDCQMIVIVA
jgi:hypothetical protein